ncbi:uncharacterized protein (DUF2252 family) [Salana multivorans]|uniref:Uncharacterized protein (DUF2252 family) n=1 Tax=Salana multivorans TaxID=120377 RepID=A0A3N2DD23_9MICO|nr:DUF2252 domain-containing protein [Salana multivorans]OJX97996.1 MAG: hypothetical protein BGO96_14015 [Micrococcales bacterium 73-15]ROR97637.1 uncharacterized protein (DUF2252 family) [Salana multivorans]
MTRSTKTSRRPVDPDLPAERLRSIGVETRSTAPRRALGTLVRGPRAALEILAEQNTGRLADLVPLRWARMLQDPFSFYRGSAAVMAADLAASPSSGIEVVSCGDAHLSNFGLFAAPDRQLLFDLNDFDEGAAAPWDWDLKRLVTSAVVGGQHAGYAPDVVERIARDTTRQYLVTLRYVLGMDALQRLYLRGHPERALKQFSPELRAVMERAMRSAQRRTSERVFKRMMTTTDEGLRLVENPPILTHLSGITSRELGDAYQAYARAVAPEIQLALRSFRYVDSARRVVGVGSVGTRCYLWVMTGPVGEPLVLQIKEATPSVLEQYGEVVQPTAFRRVAQVLGDGGRVVAAQRILQAASDPFLGTFRADGRDYYVRQFQDMKGSVDVEGMGEHAFSEYVQVCARSLARAHAQSRNAFVIDGYAGGGARLVEAVTQFAHAYADVVQEDFRALRAAADRGELDVAPDPLR